MTDATTIDFGTLSLDRFSPLTFKDTPPPQRYIIDKRLPRGKVVLLAGRGGEGKSFLLLQLFQVINNGKKDRVFGADFFNPPMPCILLMGEDDRDEVARRLHATGVDDLPEWGGIVTTPDIGPMPLVQHLIGTDEIDPTDAYRWLDNVLEGQRGVHGELGFVGIDPASVFLPVDGNSAVLVQGALNHLTHLARKHDVTIILVQHLNKAGGNKEDMTLEGVRTAVRGSAAWIDGVRAAYGLQRVPPNEAKQMREATTLSDGDLLRLWLLKSNGGLRRDSVTLLRKECGALLDVTEIVGGASMTAGDALLQVIRGANARKQALHKTGRNGLHKSLSPSWPAVLHGLSRNRLELTANYLIEQRLIESDEKRGLIAVANSSGNGSGKG